MTLGEEISLTSAVCSALCFSCPCVPQLVPLLLGSFREYESLSCHCLAFAPYKGDLESSDILQLLLLPMASDLLFCSSLAKQCLVIGVIGDPFWDFPRISKSATNWNAACHGLGMDIWYVDTCVGHMMTKYSGYIPEEPHSSIRDCNTCSESPQRSYSVFKCGASLGNLWHICVHLSYE